MDYDTALMSIGLEVECDYWNRIHHGESKPESLVLKQIRDDKTWGIAVTESGLQLTFPLADLSLVDVSRECLRETDFDS